ncbi:ABC transporter substrate-binding protein [Alteribacillus sp. YIM 98480]|uniref:ABC transporter substrate-binding protein n=1 Tax=Alteribacillus sp. YIM 98480 TaxID=2606599 RepID=UPI00131AA10E|nr:ABC transporter substrate-binding protein [Alteribacillus sp. YIM 98480]
MSKRKIAQKKLVLILLLALSIILTACRSSEPSDAQGDSDNSSENGEVPVVEIVTFEPPSLGAFLTPIIEEKTLDENNGIDIEFTERAPSAYNSEFASGQYKVGGSAALLSEALRMDRDVPVTYLFNLFDYWGALVTADENIQTVNDLEGKNMAAAKSTTNYAMFQYFLQKTGVDVGNINAQDAATSALMTYAEADRADAVQLWEPAYSTLTHDNPDKFHEVDFGLNKWEEYTGSENIPYLGVAAHQDWVEENKELVPKLYNTYMEAAKWTQNNSEEAAKLIAEQIPGGNADVIQGLIEDNDLLGLNVMPASEITEDIEAVFEAGLESDYLESSPDDSIIYSETLD